MLKNILVTLFWACTVVGCSSAPARDPKVFVREVFNPADVPPGFTNCTISHRADSYLRQGTNGTVVDRTEQNSRVCDNVRMKLGEAPEEATEILL